ncbi:hypothetical protein PMI35_00512 [Pseudomonas sp. GM78]|uniref:hypothetical protein n=1 Tax=Pseudomonas sp. GM78 TaxID=1144337 RepID=UPI00026F62C3|nr:hypothetical protein [Pseudomonas sp. GM78]EJN34763.1 hypothetical protein PMI35_00512 [Pseudomonas sp. GM78]
MHNRLALLTSSILLASLCGGTAQAALYAVDPGVPGERPYPLDSGNKTGYAAWYQDTHGRILDLCLSKAVSSRTAPTPGAPAYMCVLNPAPGEFDDTQPVVFPTNYPDETFWYAADGAITDAASGIDLTYVAAIEAAFNGEIADGHQLSFARIRIRVDVPVAGVYTVTHPYGVEVFNVTPEEFADTGGTRAINMTRDIGIGPSGDYTGALKGDIGPFLRSLNGPYTETNPETGQQEKFIGDPNLEEQVTGSPFNTNYLRVQGPNGIDTRSDTFSVSGKLSAVDLPAPALVKRASYSRGNSSGGVVAHQDVFTMAPPPPGTVNFLDSTGATVTMTEANSTGSWYGQSTVNPSVPATLQVTADNHLAVPTLLAPTTVPVQLTDLVTISRAEYSRSTGRLTIEASTSDRITPPNLTAYAGKSGALIGELSGGADKSLSPNAGTVPPATIRVTSANGGSDTEEVVIVQ